ncbi:hypothetical protein COU91_04230 [Candidatus Saccharibacteria bacterium CG10_big_fil_rev_8_21_14_0_10_47_8]|nr:MAG: hypothetical protein COU91_04230 [Candidatus Saccharibacteria bacterium CG10_big_fil_rev_8_21_14_0_10_47_8]
MAFMRYKKDNQAGFTQHLGPRLFRQCRNFYSPKESDSELSAGFIPMIIIFLLLISAAIWLVYTRIISAHQ